MQIRNRSRAGLPALALAAALLFSACATEDEGVTNRLKQGGFSEQSASELSRMSPTNEEVDNLLKARANGIDDASLVSMVRSMHKNDLTFVIGTESELLVKAGVSPTSITQLVEMGAIPRWESDVRALKEFGVADVTIVEIAKTRFVDKKEVLSGGEYARLKQFGMTDAGLLDFVRKGGTAQQLETVARELALGKSEAQAMASAGVR